MNKVKLIIKREYLTRVRKKSFVIMTFLGPILMAALLIIPAWMGMKNKDFQVIEVIDETGKFINEIPSGGTLLFEYPFKSLQEAKEKFYEEKYTSILHISGNYKNPKVELFYKKQPGVSTINFIENTIENTLQNIALKEQFNLTVEQINSLRKDVDVKTTYRDEQGNEEEKSTTINTVLGFGGATLIYFFIFLYGVQVMRGVIEEKTNRIVEIIISSVKPFQLMLGKIIGVALVGLTQFVMWIGLTAFIVFVVKSMVFDQLNIPLNIQSMINDIPVFTLLASFIFYFIGGYLLYGSFFAAIGSAVDSETDTQQFMTPITIPLIFAFITAQMIVENPEGSLAFWMSMIPLTSPIVMMVRIPFGVPVWELILSMVLLTATFIFTTWLAAKIYRTGILMYGKKATYKELWKWIKHN